MQIVIDINEDVYRYAKGYNASSMLALREMSMCINAVANGTPLPKHHGDLIDRRELKKEVYTTTEWNGDVHRIIYEASIDDAKPIIEAEGSESE